MRPIEAGDNFVHVMETPFECTMPAGGMENGDIQIRGWLTTEKKNAYDQIVHSSTFNWEGGLSRWNGRILNQHGQRFLIGGGDNTPVGQITYNHIVDGEGFFGAGYIYNQAPELLQRSVRDGTINAFSIGFSLADDEDSVDYDEETDTLNIRKGYLHEVSLVNVGANDQALFEVLNSLNTQHYTGKHGYFYLIVKGQRYLVNSKGEVHDA